MVRTPRQDLEQELRDVEFTKLYGAAQAKAELAVTLARARHRSGVTQKELGDRLGLSQPYIAKLEAGDANPTLGTVGCLLAVLGLRLVMHSESLLSHRTALTLVPSAAMAISEAPQETETFASYGTGPAREAGATSGRIVVELTHPTARREQPIPVLA